MTVCSTRLSPNKSVCHHSPPRNHLSSADSKVRTELKAATEGPTELLDIIDSEVAATNLAYSLSQVNNCLNLVKTHLARDYDEDREGGSDSRLIYDDLKTENDGQLDEIHQLRDEYGADLVSLIVDTKEDSAGEGICGLGSVYNNANPRYAFSITAWSCNTFTFAHEVGHNLVSPISCLTFIFPLHNSNMYCCCFFS